MSKFKKSIKPNLIQDADGIWCACGKCSNKLKPILTVTNSQIKMNADQFPKYCPSCGRKVKWE